MCEDSLQMVTYLLDDFFQARHSPMETLPVITKLNECMQPSGIHYYDS